MVKNKLKTEELDKVLDGVSSENSCRNISISIPIKKDMDSVSILMNIWQNTM